NGSVDIAESIPAAQMPLLTAATRREVKSVWTEGLLLNTAKGVFADPAIRAAARAAVDGKPLVDGVFGGLADAPPGLFGPALPWAAEQRVAPRRTVRPADAATVKAKTKGKAIVLAAYRDLPELPRIATVLQRQLGRAGFTVRQDVRPYAQLKADVSAG